MIFFCFLYKIKQKKTNLQETDKKKKGGFERERSSLLGSHKNIYKLYKHLTEE